MGRTARTHPPTTNPTSTASVISTLRGHRLPPLLEIYITLALVAVAGVILGLAVSASAPNDDTANSLLPIIIIPHVIFAGAIIPIKDWFTQIVATLFPIRWAMAPLEASFRLNR